MCLKKYSWVYYDLQILRFILHMYPRFIIGTNELNIILTLNVYFEYIKLLHKIFVQYILPILQVHPNYFIKLLKIITKPFIIYLYYTILHIFITYIY